MLKVRCNSNTVSSSKVNLNSDLSLVLPLFLIPLQVIVVGNYSSGNTGYLFKNIFKKLNDPCCLKFSARYVFKATIEFNTFSLYTLQCLMPLEVDGPNLNPRFQIQT